MRRSPSNNPHARPNPIEASTLDWMLQAAFGKQAQSTLDASGQASVGFLPPPRFGVDSSGTWSSTVRSPVESPAASGTDYQMQGDGWEQRGFEGMHLGQPGEFGMQQTSSEVVWPW